MRIWWGVFVLPLHVYRLLEYSISRSFILNTLMRLEVLKIIAKTINTRKRLPKGQSKMDNPGYTRRAKTKQKQNAICVGHHYTETNTNNVNKTWSLLQTNTNNVNKTWSLLQTNTNNVNKTWSLLQTRHDPSYKQLEVKMNRTSCLCGNHNGHHDTELRRKYT